jgi:hypothetical protein
LPNAALGRDQGSLSHLDLRRGEPDCATALLLRNMKKRNFAIGFAYSKSQIVQDALFGLGSAR